MIRHIQTLNLLSAEEIVMNRQADPNWSLPRECRDRLARHAEAIRLIERIGLNERTQTPADAGKE